LVLSLESARISTAESVTVQRKALTMSAEVAGPAQRQREAPTVDTEAAPLHAPRRAEPAVSEEKGKGEGRREKRETDT
jgi:hypothetical protein